MVNKLEYWPNIPYIPGIPRLSGDTCQQIDRMENSEIRNNLNKYIFIIYVIYNNL
jgi:hypothetical protein